MKVSDSLDNVPNENVVTQQVTDRQSDQLLELLEWLFATKNSLSTSVQGIELALMRFNILDLRGDLFQFLSSLNPAWSTEVRISGMELFSGE